MKKIIAGMLMAVVLAAASMADAAQVPPLINFQSVLYDDAGEAVPDGSSSVNFRITDVNGSVLYEENQTLDVVHGMVSAMVGNGLTSGGSPTGGIPKDVFEADAGRYLEVTVDGYQPQATMEIVSVPYSLYADKAMGAVDDSIGGDAIKAGAITSKHFSSDALKEIGGAMVSGDSLSMSNAAQSIGVRSGFSYSGSSNIQGVLTDLDRVMATRNTQMDSTVTNLQNQITNEVNARTSGDSILQTQITANDSDISGLGTRVGGLESPSDPADPGVSPTISYVPRGKIWAWGFGERDTHGNIIIRGGHNVVGTSTYPDILFSAAAPTNNYMVLIQGRGHAVPGTTDTFVTAYVSGRDTSGFSVRNVFSGGIFDFFVIVPQ